MKKSDEFSKAFMTNEVEEMAAKIRAQPGYKKRPATMIQAASTTAALDRQAKRKPEDDEDYWNRPMPPESEWRVEMDAEKVFAEVNKASVKDVIAAENVRHAPKNQLGQSGLSATTPERRASAIHHFEVAGNVKPADVDHEKIVGLAPIKSEPPPPLELKKKRKTIKEIGLSLMEKIHWGKK